MLNHRDSFVAECIQIVVLCVVWYSSSAIGNIVVKELLNEFPFPLTVTLVQLLSIWILIVPLIRYEKIPPADYLNQNRSYYYKVIVPLAIGKFLAQLSSHVSLWKVPVSFTHTIKATMPLFTVILSRLILREKQTLPVYISLIPIMIGVVIATMSEVSFNMTGLISALVSTFGFSLQNIYSKKSLKDISIHHYILLALLAKISCCLFIPFWFFYDAIQIYSDQKYRQVKTSSWIVFYLLFDGLLNFIHNVAAFTMISFVSPLSYSIANSSKRIVVIGLSLFILKNPVTWTNIFGMTLAIFGVILYNKAKYDQRRAQQKETILPLVHSESPVTNSELMSRHHSTSHESRSSPVVQYVNQTFKDL